MLMKALHRLLKNIVFGDVLWLLLTAENWSQWICCIYVFFLLFEKFSFRGMSLLMITTASTSLR